MKKTTFLALTLIVVFVTSCKKTETIESTDSIIYVNFDKTISYPQIDSIPGACRSLIFQIISSNQTDYSAILKVSNNLIACDGYNSILTDPDSKTITPLSENFIISSESNWSNINELSLDNFAGSTEKYIGYRSSTFPEGSDICNYGWIRISLSENKDTLNIIDQAINWTDFNSIKTGQLE